MEQKINLLNKFVNCPIYTLNKDEIKEVGKIVKEASAIFDDLLNSYSIEEIRSLSKEIEDLSIQKKIEINEIFIKLDLIKDSNRSPFSSGILRIFSPNSDYYSTNFLDLDLPSLSDLEPTLSSPYSSGKLIN